MLECSTGLRNAGLQSSSMEAAAGEIVGYLRDQFIDKLTGEPSLSLVRFYKTLPFERLEPHLQGVARAVAVDFGSLQGVQCLTLLATAGEEAAWNDRHASRAHRAIPLPTTEALARLPMVAQLVKELGFELDQVVHPRLRPARSHDRRPGGVFYVADVLDSPHVPDQNDFVVPYGIRSALGFGGSLPNGSMFTVVMFSTTPIPRETAEAFAVVAVSAKVAVLPFMERRVFLSDAPAVAVDPAAETDRALRIAESQVEALDQLLDVREQAVALQSTRLNAALAETRNRAEQLAASQAELAASEARTAAIVGGALDCIISIDAAGRVLEFNPAAEVTFGYSRHEAAGELLTDLIIPASMRARHTIGIEHYLATGEGPILNRRVEVTAVRRDGSELPVELTVTPVLDADPPAFTGYLRDITDRKTAEAELLGSRERLAHIAHTLQASLLPPVLPEIPGLQLASIYRPAGQGNEVGGDFYDVFELSDTRWALVLGDVCGKGPEAAAITALARYTVRAAAVRRPVDPAAVLAELHDAMQRQRPDSFCTVAYAVVEPDSGRIDLVLGGHPSGLRVSRTGQVTAIGGRGPMLGLVDRWAASSEVVQLAPGDTVLLYSDGVSEARRGSDMFGEARIHEVMRQSAHLGAAGVVAGIDAAVLDFASGLNDDVAMLAVTLDR